MRIKATGGFALLAASAAVLVVPGLALAAQSSNTPEGLAREVIGCTRLADPTSRLLCYDAAAGLVHQFVPAPSSTAPIPATPGPAAPMASRAPQAQAAPTAAYAPPPAARPAARPTAPRDGVLTVRTARINMAGNLEMVTSDGTTWLQQGARKGGEAPRAGTPIEVRRGSWGAYFITLPGESAVRFGRVARR